MPTEFANLRIRTDHIAGFMRRINALEDGVLPEKESLQSFQSGCGDGTSVYLLAKGSASAAFPVNVFERDGTPKAVFGTWGSTAGTIGGPKLVRFNEFVYVLHERTVTTPFIARFSTDGQFLNEWAIPDAEFYGLAVSDSRVYLLLHDNLASQDQTVAKYSKAGVGQGTFEVSVPSEWFIGVHAGADGNDDLWLGFVDSTGLPSQDVAKLRRYNATGTLQQTVTLFTDDSTARRAFAISNDGDIVFAKETQIQILGDGTYTAGQFDITADWVSDEIINLAPQGPSTDGLAIHNWSAVEQESWQTFALGPKPIGQTEWFRYPTTHLADKVSLGTPDAGVNVPALNAFENELIRANEWADMHAAIERVAPFYVNAISGNPFNWTNEDADNLYNVGFENGVYDWEKPTALQLENSRITEREPEEIEALIELLEASTPTEN